MADDVTLPGAGAVVATDDVGGRQFQLVKLAVGGKGIAVRRRAGRDAAAQAAFLAGVEIQAAADRDERDMRELQEVLAALFTFKGIF